MPVWFEESGTRLRISSDDSTLYVDKQLTDEEIERLNKELSNYLDGDD